MLPLSFWNSLCCIQWHIASYPQFPQGFHIQDTNFTLDLYLKAPQYLKLNTIPKHLYDNLLSFSFLTPASLVLLYPPVCNDKVCQPLPGFFAVTNPLFLELGPCFLPPEDSAICLFKKLTLIKARKLSIDLETYLESWK